MFGDSPTNNFGTLRLDYYGGCTDRRKLALTILGTVVKTVQLLDDWAKYYWFGFFENTGYSNAVNTVLHKLLHIAGRPSTQTLNVRGNGRVDVGTGGTE